LESIETLQSKEDDPEMRAIIISNLILEHCLFGKINSVLEGKANELETGFDENEYPQINSIIDNHQELLAEIQSTSAALCELSEKICKDCLDSVSVKETTKEKLKYILKEIERQKNNDYFPKIKKLAKNIYLAKVQQILRELDNFLEEKNLTYEEIGIDYRETIKHQSFKELDS